MKQMAYLMILLLSLLSVSYGWHHHRVSQEQTQNQEQKVAMGFLPFVGEAAVEEELAAGMAMRRRLVTNHQ